MSKKSRYKKQILVLLCVSVIVSFVLFLAFYFENVSLNLLSTLFAKKVYYLEMEGVLEPILMLSISLCVSLLPFFFLKEGVYKTWRTFTLFYLPIAILLIAISPEHSSSFLAGPSYGPDRESTALGTAVIFVLVSYLISIYKSFSLRSK